MEDLITKAYNLLKNCDYDILSFLVDNVKDYIVTYCNLKEYDNKFDNIALKMVIQDFNKMGAEGINSRNYGGVSENYSSDYSDDIYKILDKCKVHTLKTL